MNVPTRLSAVSLVVVLLCGYALRADEGGAKTGPRDTGKPSAEGGRARGKAVSKSRRKSMRIFKAYDKNSDGKVVFAEWLAMKEGAMNDGRRAREQKWFSQADADGDGGITVDEFHAWLNRKPGREGARKGPGDNPNRKSAEKRER